MTRVGQPVGGKVEIYVDLLTREVVVRLLTGIEEARLTLSESTQLGERIHEARLYIYSLP